jgi:hypothetical protein
MSGRVLPKTITPIRHRVWRSIPSHCTNFLPQAALLSTSTDDGPGKAQNRKPGPTTPPQNPSLPDFSFQGLGANRTVKVIVIVCLPVFGTIESIFWVKALWAKFSPSPEEESKPEGS